MPSEREIRLGLVLYGGVSLAVYENGIAQEIYRAMRGDGFYGLIARLIQSHIVIDIISGTSAGGVNGVMLAYALTQKRNFLPVADLWRNQGDILRLLGEREAGSDAALLDSDYYWSKLRDCFATGLPLDSTAPAIDELDLFVTSTDANGALSTVYDELGHAIDIKNHRALFKLAYRGARKDDFAKSVDDLATLCRMTSCFPVAFEPVSIPATAVNFFNWGKLRDPAVFLDGGLLNNKPFSSTIEAIASRTATSEVERFLIYVEPSPEQFCKPTVPPTPLMVRAALDSLISIPGYQSIAADLATVEAHNQRVAGIAGVLRALGTPPESTLDCVLSAGVLLPLDDGCAPEAWYRARTMQLRDAAVGALLDDLDGRGYFPVPESMSSIAPAEDALHASASRDDRRSGRLLVSSFDAWPGSGLDTLRQYDVFFRLRRVTHLTSALMAAIKATEPIPVPTLVWDTVNHFFKLYEITRWALIRWLKAVDLGWRNLSLRYPNFDTQSKAEQNDVLLAIATEIWGKIANRLNQLVYADIPVPAEPSAAARDQFYNALARPITVSSTTNLLDSIDEALKAAIAALNMSEDPEVLDAAHLLRDEFCRFLSIDRQAFLLQLGSEFQSTDLIRVVRFSPLDAQRALSAGLPRNKVRGIALGDFGGFFKKSWRANDIMVGRLDAACLLTECLLTKERLAALGPQPGAVTVADITSCFPNLSAPKSAALLDALNAYLADPNCAGAGPWNNLINLLVAAEHNEIHLAEYPNVVACAIQQEHDWGRYASVPLPTQSTAPYDPEKLAWFRPGNRPDVTIVDTAARSLASVPTPPFAPGSVDPGLFLDEIPQPVIQEIGALAAMRLYRGLLASIHNPRKRARVAANKFFLIPLDFIAPILYRLARNQRMHPESVPVFNAAIIVACVVAMTVVLLLNFWHPTGWHLAVIGLSALCLLLFWGGWLRR